MAYGLYVGCGAPPPDQLQPTEGGTHEFNRSKSRWVGSMYTMGNLQKHGPTASLQVKTQSNVLHFIQGYY